MTLNCCKWDKVERAKQLGFVREKREKKAETEKEKL